MALLATMALVVVAILVRFVYLDADPYFAHWIGYVTDEGRWAETARNLSIFGSVEGSRDARLHLVLSPAYQALTFLSFELFGVSLWSARLVAAVSGALVVITVFVALRRHVAAYPLALGVLILGFEPNMLSESRLGIPELPAALGALWCLLAISMMRGTIRNAVLIGIAAALAVALKGTTAPMVAGLAIAILMVPGADSPRQRLIRSSSLVAGFCLSVALGLAAVIASGAMAADAVLRSGTRALRFMSLAEPYAVATRLFDDPEMEIRNLLMVGMWFCSWMWIAAGRDTQSVPARLYLASAVCAGWWLVSWTAVAYLPGRYVVHFIVPATVSIMAGLSLARGNAVLAPLASRLDGARGLARLLWLAWLALPTALVVAPAVVGVAAMAGADSTSMLARCAVVAVLAAAIVVALRSGRLTEGRIAGLLAVPLLLPLLWLLARECGMSRSWWPGDQGDVATWWLLVAIAITVYLVCVFVRALSELVSVLQLLTLPLAALVLGLQSAPPLFDPSYTLKTASRDLTESLAGAERIRSMSASSLFLENELSYREMTAADTDFDSVVFFEHGRVAADFIASGRLQDFVRVGTYETPVHPRYVLNAEKNGPARVGVFRRAQRSGD